MTARVLAMADVPEGIKRIGIAVIGTGWLVIGLGYLFRSDARRVWPDLVGWLFIAAAVNVLTVAVRPASRVAFRFGAAFTVVALLSLIASLALGLQRINDPDALWSVTASIAFVVVILVLFWWFWLFEVKYWHGGHRRGRAIRRG